MDGTFHLNEELQYLLVVVGLFIVPRVLQRLRIPSAITCVAIGAALGMGFGLFHGDGVMPLLSTLGIVSLFLFAGLEVDFAELRRGLAVTIGHLLLQVALLASGTWVLGAIFDLPWRPSLLLALALLTPSTGFILDSLSAFGLNEQQQFWVKTKAIASELVALGALFFVVQSTSVESLGLMTLALGLMVVLLPSVFQIFASRILPFAPKSEFAFLMILALVCAYVTRHLGVYYLVGAFVVGVTAVRLRKRLPALASERLLIGIELFASFFIPFYFFKAGLRLKQEYFAWQAVLLGLAFVVVAVPLRVGTVAVFRRLALGEPWRDGARVGLSLVPTLVFTLVLADILRERYALSSHLFGALIVFALVNTALPGVLLRAAPPEFAEPDAPRSEPTTTVAAAGEVSPEAPTIRTVSSEPS
ncbi:MAG: cation:proton antiporter [Proteobacteria bacterium]|nr:cation:proton antiporter [Pseudomonadota bacterium]